MPRLLSIVFLVALLTPAALAVDLAGQELLIPVVGRTPGGFNSQWQTDLTVSNVARDGPDQDVLITFIRPQASEVRFSVLLRPRASVVLRDVIRETFLLNEAVGIVRIGTPFASQITARARIYNAGSSAGEFGQTIHALPLNALVQASYVPGISGTDGNRTNVGFANPWLVTTSVLVSLYSSDGSFIASRLFNVPGRENLQVNDVFTALGAAPSAVANVDIHSVYPVYPYASVVREDSGDPSFTIGAERDFPSSAAVVSPPCSIPSPLSLALRPAPTYIVLLTSEVDARQEALRLAAKYGITAFSVDELGQRFTAELTPAVVASLRCEPYVSAIAESGLGH